MQRTKIETAVGLFVLIGIICVSYLAIQLGRLELFGGKYYTVNALFNSATGLKTGAVVELAGVEVGQVEAIELDEQSQMALVRLKIEKDLQLKEYVIAEIKTSGLIGDKFIQLTSGGSPNTLKEGDTILDTVSPLDIEELIAKYVFGKVE